MFERFTEQARQVVVFSQEEARMLRHNYIGSEHLLLGLLRVGGVADVLAGFGVTVDTVRAQVAAIVGPGDEIKSGQIPFTPRAKKVLELSLQAAMSLGHNFIAPAHIVLGLLSEGEGVAVRVLLELGVDQRQLRERVLEELEAEVGRPRATEAGVVASAVRQKGAWPARLSSTLNQIGVEIRRDLNRTPDSGDLLALLSVLPDGIARRALDELGADDAALERAIADARQRERDAKLERDPELQQAIAIVHGRLERALREGDTGLASELRDLERRLFDVASGSEAASWGSVVPRLRERLGLNRDEPPGQRPAASGG